MRNLCHISFPEKIKYNKKMKKMKNKKILMKTDAAFGKDRLVESVDPPSGSWGSYSFFGMGMIS